MTPVTNPSWWNLIPSYFDGIAFSLGNFPVHWYGVMYIFAFVTAYFVIWQINKKEKLGYTKEQFDSLFTWAIAGILIGARLGYVFFYKPGYYLANPTEIILPLSHDAFGYHFTGISGMSYHGGLILGILFTIIGLKHNKMDVWKTLNLAFIAAPLAYTWGRFGNFINGELWVKNMNVAEYFYGSYNNHNARRERKLLLTRKELRQLQQQEKNPGFTIVPVRLFINEKGLAKVVVALARGKKEYDKRQSIKEKEDKREMDRMFKH